MLMYIVFYLEKVVDSIYIYSLSVLFFWRILISTSFFGDFWGGRV